MVHALALAGTKHGTFHPQDYTGDGHCAALHKPYRHDTRTRTKLRLKAPATEGLSLRQPRNRRGFHRHANLRE